MKLSTSALLYSVVVLVTVGGALYTVIFLIGGSSETVTARVAIISGLIGPALGVLILMLQQGHLQDQVQQTKDQVNGHLQQHIGHTDAQVETLIEKRLGQLQAAASPLELKPTDPPTGGSA